MSRYIDADALKEKYTMVIKRYSGGIMERPAVLLETIDDAPSIDIVRCKECGAYMTDGYVDGCGFCAYHHSVVKADDFCSYGDER